MSRQAQAEGRQRWGGQAGKAHDGMRDSIHSGRASRGLSAIGYEGASSSGAGLPGQAGHLLRLWRGGALEGFGVGAVGRHAGVQAGAACSTGRGREDGEEPNCGQLDRANSPVARLFHSTAALTANPSAAPHPSPLTPTWQEAICLCVIHPPDEPHEL